MLVERLSIDEAIKKLYSAAGIAQPGAEALGIVPLRRLVGAFGLICVELPDLTAASAKDFLRQSGVTNIGYKESEKNKALAGFLYVTTNYGCVFVNKKDPVTRRRFSVAHEIGHYLLHFRPILDAFKRVGELIAVHHSDRQMDIGDDSPDNAANEGFFGERTIFDENKINNFLPPERQMEDEANDFAGELLLPAGIVRARAEVLKITEDDFLRRMASDLLVSRSATERRLKDLDLL